MPFWAETLISRIFRISPNRYKTRHVQMHLLLRVELLDRFNFILKNLMVQGISFRHLDVSITSHEWPNFGI